MKPLFACLLLAALLIGLLNAAYGSISRHGGRTAAGGALALAAFIAARYFPFWS